MAACVSWEAQARERQQEICELVTDYDWELYKSSERNYLREKVEYIMFGPINNQHDGETETIIKKLYEKILQEGNRGKCLKDETCLAFIYVFWTENGEELRCWPIFKVPKDKNGVDAYFIDINSRVYKDWNDFLQNNQFPACEYCYPKGGEYMTDENGIVILDYGKSPASSFSKNVVQYLDYTNAGLAVGTTAVAAASLFLPVAGPLLQASLWLTRGICAYTTMRSGSTLLDRSTHKQSVGLKDSESRNCWFSIGGSVLGAASSSATNVTAKMAQSGRVMGRFGCATVTTLNLSTVAVNGLGLMNSFHCLIDKYNKNQLTSLDVFQFSASLLLFAHAAVNVQTAKTIIEKTQNGVIQDFENNLRSNRHRKVFRRVVRNTKYQKNSMEGNAQVIRSLKHINNVDDFFSALVRMDKQFRPTQSRATFTDGGLITINENLPLDPTRLVQATPEQRILILEATKKYAGNKISDAEFRTMTESIIGKTPPVLAPQGSQLKLTLKEILGLVKSENKVTPNIGSKYSYPLLSAYEKMEIMTLLKKFEESDHERILQIATTLLRALGWTSGLQYVEVSYFVGGLIINIAKYSKVEKRATSASNNITTTEYCQLALQQIMKNPSKLVEIFQHVKFLYDVLLERDSVPTRFRHVGLYEISQLAGILLIMNQPLWLRLITFAEQIFCVLGLRKPELIINITKGLCQNIQDMLIDIERDIERKQYLNCNAVPQIEHYWSEERKEISRKHCSAILNTLTDDSDIQKTVVEEIHEDYVSVTSLENSIELKYTEQKPLIINRSFWDKGELQLLSEEEILDICRQSLCTELWPADCSIDRHDISKIFVNIDEKLIVLECDFNKGIISAYVSVAVAL